MTDESTYQNLVEFIKSKKIVCPQPMKWNELYEMLPDKQRTGLGWAPPLPLILAAWWDTPIISKRARFREHLDYAYEKGVIKQMDTFLRSLKDEDWFFG